MTDSAKGGKCDMCGHHANRLFPAIDTDDHKLRICEECAADCEDA